MDPYQLAADTLTVENIPTDELESVRQDLQSGMVDQCRSLMKKKYVILCYVSWDTFITMTLTIESCIFLCRRDTLDNIHHKLTGVQSMLLYSERFGRQPVIDTMSNVSGGGTGHASGPRMFSAAGPGRIGSKPDRTQLTTVTLMNDKIIEVPITIDDVSNCYYFITGFGFRHDCGLTKLSRASKQ